MTLKKVVAAIVLLDFAALNAYALWDVGLGGLIPALTQTNMVGHVLHVDLVIALGLILVWMWRDAKRTGRNPWGYALLTLGTGSIGPLLYIILGRSDRTTTEADNESAEGNQEEMDVGHGSLSTGTR